jgi:hypothetical protein
MLGSDLTTLLLSWWPIVAIFVIWGFYMVILRRIKARGGNMRLFRLADTIASEKAHEEQLAALRATIARLEVRIAELEKRR